jgi:hypothetical protein
VCVCVCARARACVLVKRITDKVVFPYEEASSFPQSAQERLPLLPKEKTILPPPIGMQLNLTNFSDNAEHV